MIMGCIILYVLLAALMLYFICDGMKGFDE
jgi:hypothetical protein